ncbi:MAG: hypothetical protein GY929_09025 [Actinomycetia bacterium]|nr:hypothetical protein [Actinomycetes bacterium]
MVGDNEVGWDIEIDTRGAVQGLDDLRNTASGTEQGVTGSFGGIAGAAKGLIAGVAVREVVQFGVELDRLGRTARQWEAQATQVFRHNAAEVADWAGQNRRQFGSTTRELQGLAAQVGATSRSIGFSTGEAAAFSTELVGMAGQLAIVNPNIRDVAEGTELLTGILTGEIDALQQVGITLDAAAVKAEVAARRNGDLAGLSDDAAAALVGLEHAARDAGIQTSGLTDETALAEIAMNEMRSEIDQTKENVAVGFSRAVDVGVLALGGLIQQSAGAVSWLGNLGSTAQWAGAMVAAIPGLSGLISPADITNALSPPSSSPAPDAIWGEIAGVPGPVDPAISGGLGGAIPSATATARLFANGTGASSGGGGGGGGRAPAVNLTVNARPGFYTEVDLGRLAQDSIRAYTRETGDADLHSCL